MNERIKQECSGWQPHPEHFYIPHKINPGFTRMHETENPGENWIMLNKGGFQV